MQRTTHVHIYLYMYSSMHRIQLPNQDKLISLGETIILYATKHQPQHTQNQTKLQP